MDEKKKITPKELILPIALTLILALLIGASLLLNGGGGTQNPPSKSKDFYNCFDTVSRFYDFSGMTDEEFARVSALVEERLDFYHRQFDIYNSYAGVTNIKTLNDNAGGEPSEISNELFAFLEYSKEIYTLTSGEVNVAMGAVLRIWHSYREAGEKIPEKEELLRASEHTDINKLLLDKENRTALLQDPEMSLDVGALAKGYAAEKIAEELLALGYTSLVLDLGGNLKAIGTKPDGAGWETGVKNPDPKAEGYLYTFTLSDASAVTSGDYERYYTVGGKRYHHIIDKDTLMPSEHFTSVTVITGDSALADALSTALFNMSYEDGAALVDSLENVRAVWLTKDGKTIIK